MSWALLRGLPEDPAANRLAIRTEDHPLEYASFEGEIPPGQYGAGTARIWDRGTYQTEKWTDEDIKVAFRGSSVSGRYVLIHTGGNRGLPARDGPGRLGPWSVGPLTGERRQRSCGEARG